MCLNWMITDTTPHKEGKAGQSIRGGILTGLDTGFARKFNIYSKKCNYPRHPERSEGSLNTGKAPNSGDPSLHSG